MSDLNIFRIKTSVGSLALVAALGVIVGSAHAAGAGPQSPAQFEPASISVPVGNKCVLHPEGNADPAQSLTLDADEDGVARFEALRATQPNSVERLALDCIDANGDAQTYAVDLKSAETFAPRPFEPAQTHLTLRPALSGDPKSYTQQELLRGGYGLRPNPSSNPDSYQRWLAAVSEPAYQLPSAAGRSEAEGSSQPAAPIALTGKSQVVKVTPSTYWIGALISGSYKVGPTADQTYSYVQNEATFNIPAVYYKGGTGPTHMSIWNGLDNVFQAIVFLDVTTNTAKFHIHHQFIFDNEHGGWTKGSDEGGTAPLFTPRSGDTVFAEEWYCDAQGNLNLAGGHACTWMIDRTQHVQWECDQADSTACESYTLAPKTQGNGKLGYQADFIIENDTAEINGSKNENEWPLFSPVTMTGAAYVVQGSGVSGKGNGVTTTTDPKVVLKTDATASNPFVRGDGHLLITLPTGGIKWTELATNIYYLHDSNFNSYSIACAGSIGVGPGQNGLPNGTPWTTGCHPDADGNRDVYQLQYDPQMDEGTWIRMQPDAAVQVAVSPGGDAWAINASGEILRWVATKFVPNALGGCASSIAVGPNSIGLVHGTPWITGCSAGKDGNHDVYEYQADGTWIRRQSDVAIQLASSPEGDLWAINKAGDVLWWNDGAFVVSRSGHCATSIAVGPHLPGRQFGTPWITGCDGASNENHSVYELSSDGSWTEIEADVGQHVAVSPEGEPWAISTWTPVTP
jgi:hypothetical protein